jgi:eukaryotic-like serine/threonine-protein kinase
MNPAKTLSQTSFEVVDRFECDLRSGRVDEVTQYFPDSSALHYEDTVAEILRVLLEWKWSQGITDYFSTMYHGLDVMQMRPRVLQAVLFEDHRLHLVHSRPISQQHYASIFGGTVGSLDALNFFDSLDFPGRDSRASQLRNGRDETEREFQAITDAASSHLLQTSLLDLKSGDEVGDFKLLGDLNKGAFSRVFIATQRSLANRFVVLKVTSLPMGESQKLARLQHSNIVPLYSVQNAQNLFILCMPFLGSISLRDVIRFARRQADTPPSNIAQAGYSFSGPVVIDAISSDILRLNNLHADLAAVIPSHSSAMNAPNQPLHHWLKLDCCQTVTRVGIELAAGLQYAHSRNLLHGDIKPANVLIGFDGTILLLDFNLSRLRNAATGAQSRTVGGTIPYMAPEQLTGYCAGQDSSSTATDLYSVGVVLYELLTGRLPVEFSSSDVSAPDIALLQHRHPIVSPLEHDGRISPGLSTIIMKCLEKDPRDRYGTAAELVDDLQRHQADLPLKFATNPSLTERFHKFRRRNAQRLRTVLFVSFISILLVGTITLTSAWVHSTRIVAAGKMYEQFQSLARRAEASLFFADGGSRAEGLKLAEQAVEYFSTTKDNSPIAPSYLVQYLEPAQAMDVNQTKHFLSRLIQQRPETYLLDSAELENLNTLEQATAFYFQRQYQEAMEIIQQEVAGQPDRFAIWFLKGQIHFEQREYQEAETAFAIATSCAPACAITWVARGNCCYWKADYGQALKCFSEAERAEPTLAAIWYNRGLVYERQDDPAAAAQQFAKARDLSPESTRFTMAHSRVLRALGKLEEAEALLTEVTTKDPLEPEGWILRGLAKLGKSPEEALLDFEKAQAFDRTFFAASQNRAHVLSEILGRREEAIAVLSEALKRDSKFAPALTGRAVLYARVNQRSQALADLQQCKQLNPTPQIHYQMACAYALLATDPKDTVTREAAMYHLAKALAPGYGGPQLATDPDLANLRDERIFSEIKKGIAALYRLSSSPQTHSSR